MYDGLSLSSKMRMSLYEDGCAFHNMYYRPKEQMLIFLGAAIFFSKLYNSSVNISYLNSDVAALV